MAAQIPHLRVIHLAQNQGKAIALKTGAAAAKSEYLVCIDGDALLDRDAAAYIVEPMLYNIGSTIYAAASRSNNASPSMHTRYSLFAAAAPVLSAMAFPWFCAR